MTEIDQDEIRFYRATGQYGFLSNLCKIPIEFEGRKFRCAEEAYQYGKPRDPRVAEWIVSAPKPHLCAAAAHALLSFDIREDWNEIKVDRMREVLRAKFSQDSALKNLLFQTYPKSLVEASKTDAFWGTGKKGNGKNMLGTLLAEVRDDLWWLECPELRTNDSGDALCAATCTMAECCIFPNCAWGSSRGHRWMKVLDGNPDARVLADKHYSRKKPGSRYFVGPGEKLVLLSQDKKALFVWRKSNFRKDGQAGIECTVFRNESLWLSSDLIQSAVKLAGERWPGERLFTYVDGQKVKSTNPGHCFIMAGWKKCGRSKDRDLLILEWIP